MGDAPRYESIADDLRRRILDGEFERGSQLPLLRDLMDHYRVSRTTVREAVQRLATDGVVTTRQGRGGGTFIVQAPVLVFSASRAEIEHPSTESDAFVNEVRASGYEPGQTIHAERRPLPADIAHLLGVPVGAEAVLRRCLRTVDGEPNSIQDSWYPLDLLQAVPELARQESITPGATRLMAVRGITEVAWVDDHRARIPTDEERKLLNLRRVGEAVLEFTRVARTKDRTPVRVSVTTFSGARTIVRYTLGDVDVLRSLAL